MKNRSFDLGLDRRPGICASELVSTQQVKSIEAKSIDLSGLATCLAYIDSPFKIMSLKGVLLFNAKPRTCSL